MSPKESAINYLRIPENLEDLVKYVLENPVRKELVDSYLEYPWSWDRYGIKGLDE
jgi:hypothetical protein